nr:PREDICTED: uncharacterized protein LOC107079889 isoform X2 [Lepisosteus oculatus]
MQAFLALLLNVCYGNFTARVFGDQPPLLDIAVYCFFILGSAAHLLLGRSQVKGLLDLSKSFGDHGFLFLQVDFLATFVFGLLWLAYPDWLLGFQTSGPEDELHLHLTRAFGAMMVGDSFVSLTALGFRSDKDKTSVFVGRTVGTLVLLLFMVYTQTTTSAWTKAHIWFGMVGAGLWTGNSVLGYFTSKESEKED